MKRLTVNEFGERLDSNGYAKSIVQSDTSMCFLCKRATGKLDRHELMGGVANRQKSKAYGLWVSLCHYPCHEGPTGPHMNAKTALYLHQVGQKAAMEAYGWTTEGFIKQFGKNYL